MSKSQIHFSGSSNCPEFKSNPFAKSGTIVRVCMNCGTDIAEHGEETVSEVSAQKVLESVEKIPSKILPDLYLGGFISAMNVQFILSNNIGLVVNTAKGLEIQFPKFSKIKDKYIENDITLREIEWVDSEDQRIDSDLLMDVILDINRCLSEGKGVLVHCAQGRSRSTTVVVAFIMWAQQTDYLTALDVVQRHRSMAQPNRGFALQLGQQWAASCQEWRENNTL